MQSIIVGKEATMERMDAGGWLEDLKSARDRAKTRTAFMTDMHHRVRRFVVAELLRRARPISPSDIAREVGLDLSAARRLLADLERNLFFLVRNEEGEVTWAYPVTCEKTPHRLEFSTGEHIFAA